MKFKFKNKPFHRIPNANPISQKLGLIIFLGLVIIGVLIGATIATYVYFGTITLAGLIALIESNKYLKYVASKSNKLLDVIIFTVTLYATISLGISITASLTFAGLGYTLVYAPWLRKRNK